MVEQYDYNQSILMLIFVVMAIAIPGAMILLDNNKMKNNK